MKIEKHTTPDAVITELGIRIAQQRITLGLTQADAAKQAGIGKRTIERIETGADIQLSTLIRLLRVLELTENLNQLIPAVTESPMERLKRQIKPRKRVTKKHLKPKGP